MSPEEQDELRTVRTVYHHRCECGEDEACQFARERDAARADLREAVTLLRRVAEFHLQSNNEGELAREADALLARRDALLAKHKEMQ